MSWRGPVVLFAATSARASPPRDAACKLPSEGAASQVLERSLTRQMPGTLSPGHRQLRAALVIELRGPTTSAASSISCTRQSATISGATTCPVVDHLAAAEVSLDHAMRVRSPERGAVVDELAELALAVPALLSMVNVSACVRASALHLLMSRDLVFVADRGLRGWYGRIRTRRTRIAGRTRTFCPVTLRAPTLKCVATTSSPAGTEEILRRS